MSIVFLPKVFIDAYPVKVTPWVSFAFSIRCKSAFNFAKRFCASLSSLLWRAVCKNCSAKRYHSRTKAKKNYVLTLVFEMLDLSFQSTRILFCQRLFSCTSAFFLVLWLTMSTIAQSFWSMLRVANLFQLSLTLRLAYTSVSQSNSQKRRIYLRKASAGLMARFDFGILFGERVTTFGNQCAQDIEIRAPTAFAVNPISGLYKAIPASAK